VDIEQEEADRAAHLLGRTFEALLAKTPTCSATRLADILAMIDLAKPTDPPSYMGGEDRAVLSGQ
jgi:hypothetical protein